MVRRHRVRSEQRICRRRLGLRAPPSKAEPQPPMHPDLCNPDNQSTTPGLDNTSVGSNLPPITAKAGQIGPEDRNNHILLARQRQLTTRGQRTQPVPHLDGTRHPGGTAAAGRTKPVTLGRPLTGGCPEPLPTLNHMAPGAHIDRAKLPWQRIVPVQGTRGTKTRIHAPSGTARILLKI